MWLLQQDAILTKDNLIRRKWKGNTKCVFCQENETIAHPFLGCNISKYVWSIIAWTIKAPCRLESLEQYMVWAKTFMPNDRKFHVVGLSAVCWAIWKLRNRACFEKKLIRSPTEIICYACVFIKFWARFTKGGRQTEARSRRDDAAAERNGGSPSARQRRRRRNNPRKLDD